ncbi:MAG: hypothetical protein NVS4B3_14960 [Gemmatimonadaceae bacterium]
MEGDVARPQSLLTGAAWAFALGAATAGCARLTHRPSDPVEASESRPPEAPSVAAERSVYAALLDSVYVTPRTRKLAVAAESADLTSGKPVVSAWLRHPSALRSETFNDFRERNGERWTLAAKPRLRVPVDLLGPREERRLATGGSKAWQEFGRRYAESPGLIQLSRAGFNSDSSQAFVVVDRNCGAGCGEVAAYLLTRRATGRWQVAERHVLGRSMMSSAGEVAGRPQASRKRRKGAGHPTTP